ncbi:MAG: recombinase family protein [Methanomassiliicoccales archaeon]|nr:recombinase family protein [Methanomassiliicoccales archaeon]
MEGDRMRAALYARVSTEDQAKEGFSIPAQLKRLNAYCKARGWQATSEYIDDGYSGRSTKRPAYERMIREKDSWDVLVVLKMDRIHRNSRNFALMMDDLDTWKKEFNSMQEAFDTTTAIGRFVMDTIQRIAQLESEQIGERVKMGMTQKAKKGAGYLGFGQPYGYHYSGKKLTVVEPEADAVRCMFKLYADGLSLQDVADRLNSDGVSTKRGASWSKGSVFAVLTNPLYTGHVSWDGILRPAGHQPIVATGDFDAVQAMMSLKTRGKAAVHVSFIRQEEEVHA